MGARATERQAPRAAAIRDVLDEALQHAPEGDDDERI
jgi:hypothetical protein